MQTPSTLSSWSHRIARLRCWLHLALYFSVLFYLRLTLAPR